MENKPGRIAEQAALILVKNAQYDNGNHNNTLYNNHFHHNDTNGFFFGSGDSATSSNNVSSVDQYNVPTGLIILLGFLYGSISLLAVIGNGLVILVIVRNRLMHTVTNIFIANLAVADVIIGIFSIPFQFQAALLQRWVLANFMCSLAPFVQIISVNVSIFTLSVIAIDRYIAVIHPFKAGCSRKSASIIISVIWAIAIGAALPVPLFYWVEPGEAGMGARCEFHSPKVWPDFLIYFNAMIISIQYVLPLLVITYCYCRIAWHIWGARRPGAHVTSEDVRGRNKRKVVKMMIIVVCLFVLCWMPLQLYNMLGQIKPSINDYKYINIIWFCSNWFAMSNSCYNPFIYGLLNEKFKREFRHLFAMCPCQKQASSEYYTEYFSEDGNMSRRANNNHRGSQFIPSNRHGAVRYNFNRNDKNSYIKGHPIHGEETETSQI